MWSNDNFYAWVNKSKGNYKWGLDEEVKKFSLDNRSRRSVCSFVITSLLGVDGRFLV